MNMNKYIYYKKLYTVAFRLTGGEEASYKLIDMTLSLSLIKKEKNNYATLEEFKFFILEMLKLYIKQNNLFYIGLDNNEIIDTEDYVLKLQRALLELNPINRALIIWKDLLGFKIDEILQIIPLTKEELYAELNCSYRILKRYLNAN